MVFLNEVEKAFKYSGSFCGFFLLLFRFSTLSAFNKGISKLSSSLQEGAGLGRSGQGMSTALKVERLGKNSGVIVNEHELNIRGLF